MIHTCHAMGCETAVSPEKLMCMPHWFQVPPALRAGVWAAYRVGQCYDQKPSRDWLVAATRAICAVAVKEGALTQEQANARIASAVRNTGGIVLPSRLAVASDGVSPSIASTQLRVDNIEGSGTGTDRFEAVTPEAKIVGSASEEAQGLSQSSPAPAAVGGSASTAEPAGQGKGHQAGTLDPVPSLATALSPFIRWAGGKRWLVDKLVPEIVACKPRLYVEPFLGAGAIALALASVSPVTMLLSDYSQPLINLWTMVVTKPTLVAAQALMVQERYGNNRAGYLEARKRFNAIQIEEAWPPDQIEAAALMLYLNTVNYNGLWRMGKRGYNVPFGDVKNPSVPPVDELLTVQAAMLQQTISCRSFDEQLQLPLRAIEGTDRRLEGVVIFADPPYHDGFDSYVQGGFTDEQHAQLAGLLQRHAEAGARVFATNADTDFIREIYAWAKIEEIVESRNVAQKVESRRRKAKCLLIRGGPR